MKRISVSAVALAAAVCCCCAGFAKPQSRALLADSTRAVERATLSSPAGLPSNGQPSGTPMLSGFSPGNLRNNFGSWVGLEFTVGANALTVTSLGRLYVAGNTGTHTVKLVNASTKQDVAGGSVTVSLPSGTPGQFAYTALASPIQLPANTSYYLVSMEQIGGDQWYDITPVTPGSVVTVPGPVYYDGFVPWFVVPGGPSMSYGPLNLLYSTAAPPAVSVTSPAANLSVSGNAVTLSATATAGAGLTIASVQFQVDGKNSGVPVTASPYNSTLDATTLINGPHTLTAVATDSAGASATSPAVSVTVNNPLPTVTITAPANNSTITGKPVTINAAAGPGLTVASVQFKVDNINLGSALTASPYTTNLDSTTLNNGAHTITAVVTDSAGNTATSSISVTSQNVLTSVLVTAPSANATISGSSVSVTAITTPATGLTISSVQFKVDGAIVGSAQTASPYGITLDTTKLLNGAHLITAIATDSSSYVAASAPISVTVSNPPPTVQVTAPGAGATLTGTTTLTATAAAGTGLTLASIQFMVDNVNQAAAGTTSPYSVQLNTNTLANGTHGITAVATDSAGNATTSSPVSVTVNNAPPPGTALLSGFSAGSLRNNFGSWVGLKFTVGSNGLNVTSLGRVYVAGNTGAHTVKLVNASTNQDVPGASVTVTLPSGTAGQFAYTALASPIQLPANTSYYLVSLEKAGGDQWYDVTPVTPAGAVTVPGPVYYDGAAPWVLVSGLTSMSFVPVNLIYTPAPTVSITSPQAGAVVFGSAAQITATATAASGVTISSVTFAVDGKALTGTVTSTGSSYSITLNTMALSNGTHSLTAVATDSAGSSATSAAVSVMVGNIPTSISLTAPANGTTVAGSALVAATAIPGSGFSISSVQFKVDGAVLPGTVTVSGNNYSLSMDTTKLTNGTHVITAVATDSGNNVATSPGVSVTVTNLPTTINIISPGANATIFGTVTVSATANAGTGLTISSVQFKVDGTVFAGTVSMNGNVYSLSIDTTKLTTGSHVITAVATDSGNNVVTSAGVSVTVNNVTTNISISAPGANSTIFGSVTLSASTFPGSGLTISSVQFKVDGAVLAGTISNSGNVYSTLLDATKLVNGPHSIVAVATDSGNNVVTSPSVTVTVNNQMTTVTITSPSANATLTGTITAQATAVPASGLTIASVVFKLDGVTLPGIVSNSGTSYSLLVNAVNLVNGAHILTAVATDSGNNVVTSATVSVTVNNINIPSLPAGMSFDGSIFIAGDEYRFLPKFPGQGPQSLNRGISFFNNVPDPVISLGYNQLAVGSVIQSGEPGLSWNIEGNYNDGTPNPKMEAYVQYISEDGTRVIRPFFFQIDRTTRKLVGSWLYGDPLHIQSSATGASIAQFGSTITIMFTPVQVNAPLAAQVIQSIPQSTDPGCDSLSIGKIWFDNTTNTTVERHCLSISGVPTWVVK